MIHSTNGTVFYCVVLYWHANMHLIQYIPMRCDAMHWEYTNIRTYITYMNLPSLGAMRCENGAEDKRVEDTVREDKII